MLLLVALAHAGDPAAEKPADKPAENAPLTFEAVPLTRPAPKPELEIVIPRIDVTASVNAGIDQQLDAKMLERPGVDEK